MKKEDKIQNIINIRLKEIESFDRDSSHLELALFFGIFPVLGFIYLNFKEWFIKSPKSFIGLIIFLFVFLFVFFLYTETVIGKAYDELCKAVKEEKVLERYGKEIGNIPIPIQSKAFKKKNSS